jgi:hypothetical protein
MNVHNLPESEIRHTYEHSGADDGEPVSAAIRRHVAWILLALREHGEVDPAVVRDIRAATDALAVLSLEVEVLEARAAKARRKEGR